VVAQWIRNVLERELGACMMDSECTGWISGQTAQLWLEKIYSS